MYHDIVNIDARNIPAVIKFTSELYDFQKRNFDGQNPYECYDVISKYLQINPAMFITMSTVAMVYGYKIMCLSDMRTCDELVDIVAQFNMDTRYLLNGLQSMDENINAFYDIAVAVSTPMRKDAHLNNIVLEMLDKYSNVVLSNLKNHYNSQSKYMIRNSEYLTCMETLDAVSILCKDSNSRTLYDNSNLFGTIASTIVSHVLNTVDTDANKRDYYKYIFEQEIPNVLYMYILPAMCLDVCGLADVIYLLRRVRSVC